MTNTMLTLAMGVMSALTLGSCCSAEKEQEAAQPQKVADYLWQVDVENYCDTVPNCMLSGLGKEFACSAVRNGNYYGRNLDFFISEGAEIVVRTPAKDGRHATIGVCGLSGVTDADIEKGLTKEQMDVLPWSIYDGINDAGLFCNMNVTSYDDGGDQTGTNPGKPDLSNLFLLRSLLDNCGSVDEAIEFVNSHNMIGKRLGEFNLHFMIGDPNKNVVLEFIDNKAVFKEQTIMTNFYVNMPKPNPHADGIERYDILKANYAEGGESMEGMWNLLKRVQFSQAYDPDVKPLWKTENLNGRTYDAPVEVVLADTSIQRDMRNFKHFKETGEYKPEWKLWFTVHNSTYDIAARKLRVTVREKYDKHYDFELGK